MSELLQGPRNQSRKINWESGPTERPGTGRTFDLLQACFWLIAALAGVALVVTAFAGIGCVWMVLYGTEKLGSCSSIGTLTREVWTELLAAIFALLFWESNRRQRDRNDDVRR